MLRLLEQIHLWHKKWIINRGFILNKNKEINTNHYFTFCDLEVDQIFFQLVIYLFTLEMFFVTYSFHGSVVVWLDQCMLHIKIFIRTFCSLYKTECNEIFVKKKLLNPHIEQSVRCYIEPSTWIYIKILSKVRPRFTYIS